VCVCVDVRLGVNQAGTNGNRCTQRLVILYVQTY